MDMRGPKLLRLERLSFLQPGASPPPWLAALRPGPATGDRSTSSEDLFEHHPAPEFRPDSFSPCPSAEVLGLAESCFTSLICGLAGSMGDPKLMGAIMTGQGWANCTDDASRGLTLLVLC